MSAAGKDPARSHGKPRRDLELSPEGIRSRILFVRGKRGLLDVDLARFYGVKTSNLNKAVARNAARFPEDFAFRLTRDETQTLIFQSGTSKEGGSSPPHPMFQSGTSKPGRGGTRKPASVFTEQGV